MITQDRYNHMIAVANKMKELAEKHNEFEINPNDAFTLGLLHDIGYEFVHNNIYHAFEGGQVLKDQGYKYWQEIKWHGIPQVDYISPQLQLLNYVDMTTGPTGEYITIEERLADIAVRYTENSPQHINAIKMAHIVKEYNLIKNIILT